MHFKLFIFTFIEQTYNIYILLVEYHSINVLIALRLPTLLWVTEPRFKLGPAVQQDDALLSEPRRTLNFLIAAQIRVNFILRILLMRLFLFSAFGEKFCKAFDNMYGYF
jgi:hypothetical protein